MPTLGQLIQVIIEDKNLDLWIQNCLAWLQGLQESKDSLKFIGIDDTSYVVEFPGTHQAQADDDYDKDDDDVNEYEDGSGDDDEEEEEEDWYCLTIAVTGNYSYGKCSEQNPFICQYNVLEGIQAWSFFNNHSGSKT